MRTTMLARTSQTVQGFVGALERMYVLDGMGKALGSATRRLIRPGAPREVLSGTWLGHPAHPPLTDVVIGSVLSAFILDVLHHDGSQASERLLQVGIAAAIPTAATGIEEWADSELADPRVRRVGLVHAAANVSALACSAGSLAARKRGSVQTGRALTAVAVGALGFGGFLGGHLSYTRGIGPNQTSYDPGPSDWTTVTGADHPSVGKPTVGVAGDTPVLLVQGRDGIHALHARCSHRGCSLGDGDLGGNDLDGIVVACVCHGSEFDVRDGAVVRGPATAGQPVFDVREGNGQIAIRRNART